MAASCMQILKELTGPGPVSSSSAVGHPSNEDDTEALRKLAAELALVAAAAQAGPRAYVLGRSRGMWASAHLFRMLPVMAMSLLLHCADKACESSATMQTTADDVEGVASVK